MLRFAAAVCATYYSRLTIVVNLEIETETPKEKRGLKMKMRNEKWRENIFVRSNLYKGGARDRHHCSND
jgi:hypothetical protein